MGGGLEADLSQGGVPALWSAPPAEWAGRRPVLQVADVRHEPDGTGLPPAPAQFQRYSLLLSDGVYSQHATLAPALTHLASGGDLRRGSVVRVLCFVPATNPDHVRTIVIIQLEILQTECALIGSLKLYKPTRNFGVLSTSRSMSSGLRSDCKPCFGVTQMGPSCGCYPSGVDKLSVWKLVGQIKDENLGYSDKPDLITVKATISFVTGLLCHGACPQMVNGKRCNAKATEDVDGTWHCNRCEYSFLEPCKYGCCVRIQIQDHTGTASATAYEEAAEEILGCRAKDLYSMKYKEHDHAQLGDITLCAMGKQFVFQLKVRLLSSGMKCVVLKAEKVNPLAESHRLLGQINTLLQEGSGSGLELHSPTMHTLDARMQQLTLNDRQNQRFMVSATGDAFSCASPMLSYYLQDSPGLSGAMVVQLTPGAVVAVSKHADGNGMLQPVLQVVDVRIVNNVNYPSTERFRMVLSDGVYMMQSMLTTAENRRVWDGSIRKGSIIHLQEFTCSTIQNCRFIIVLKLYVVQSECNIIGNPKPYKMRNQRNEQVTNLPANAENEPPLCTIIGVQKLEDTNNTFKDVSGPILKDDMSYTPNVGSVSLEATQSILTSSDANGCATGVGSTGFARLNWMPIPLSSSSEGCDFNGDLMGRSAVRGARLCFRCNQPGHCSKDCLV